MAQQNKLFPYITAEEFSKASQLAGELFDVIADCMKETADILNDFLKAMPADFIFMGVQYQKNEQRKERHRKRYQRMMNRQVKIRFYKIR